MKHLKFTLSALLLFCTVSLQSQENITVSGGDATGSGGTAAYSVGQIVYTTNTGADGSVAQGVQQPYEISIVDGIEQADGINLELKVYPNPTNDFLNLIVEDYNNEMLSYQLYDINGQIIKQGEILGIETTIMMEFQVPGNYLLIVFDDQSEVKTFKIIKN